MKDAIINHTKPRPIHIGSEVNAPIVSKTEARPKIVCEGFIIVSLSISVFVFFNKYLQVLLGSVLSQISQTIDWTPPKKPFLFNTVVSGVMFITPERCDTVRHSLINFHVRYTKMLTRHQRKITNGAPKNQKKGSYIKDIIASNLLVLVFY